MKHEFVITISAHGFDPHTKTVMASTFAEVREIEQNVALMEFLEKNDLHKDDADMVNIRITAK